MGNKAKHGRIRFIDLFAGCGGLSEGFIQAGYAANYKMCDNAWRLGGTNLVKKMNGGEQ